MSSACRSWFRSFRGASERRNQSHRRFDKTAGCRGLVYAVLSRGRKPGAEPRDRSGCPVLRFFSPAGAYCGGLLVVKPHGSDGYAASGVAPFWRYDGAVARHARKQERKRGKKSAARRIFLPGSSSTGQGTRSACAFRREKKLTASAGNRFAASGLRSS